MAESSPPPSRLRAFFFTRFLSSCFFSLSFFLLSLPTFSLASSIFSPFFFFTQLQFSFPILIKTGIIYGQNPCFEIFGSIFSPPKIFLIIFNKRVQRKEKERERERERKFSSILGGREAKILERRRVPSRKGGKRRIPLFGDN